MPLDIEVKIPERNLGDLISCGLETKTQKNNFDFSEKIKFFQNSGFFRKRLKIMIILF